MDVDVLSTRIRNLDEQIYLFSKIVHESMSELFIVHPIMKWTFLEWMSMFLRTRIRNLEKQIYLFLNIVLESMSE